MFDGNVNQDAAEKQKELDRKRNQVPVSSNAKVVTSYDNKDDGTKVYTKNSLNKTSGSTVKGSQAATTEKSDNTEYKGTGKAFSEDKRGKRYPNTVGDWFITVCCIQIPVVGLIILLILAFYPKNINPSKKAYARAYLIYRILVWCLAALVLYILYLAGADFVDNALSYIGKSVV
ncbi:MAG: hypothetical protein K6D02_05370 [Lachnospiraceae bacterium]|nr:hypothetical protein [Lachnospiraceae bacterium]